MQNLRKYGKKPFSTAVIHGGLGAAGEMATLARELSSTAGILETLQTAASVNGQIEELHAVLKENAAGCPDRLLMGSMAQLHLHRTQPVHGKKTNTAQ